MRLKAMCVVLLLARMFLKSVKMVDSKVCALLLLVFCLLILLRKEVGQNSQPPTITGFVYFSFQLYDFLPS
jgi:hypothetical protein